LHPNPDPAAGLPPAPSAAPGNRGRGGVVVILAVLVMLTGAVAFALGFDAGLALDALRTHQEWLRGFVAGAPVQAALLFMAIYALGVAVSVPGLAVLTVIGGYLFGWLAGTAYVLVATTLAATAVFIAARSAIGEPLRARAGPSLLRFAEGFRSNALSYVFLLNLVPIFPYALVIGIPAACGVGLRMFLVSALLGLLPGTLVFAYLGSGLGEVLSTGQPVSLTSLLRPDIVISLVGLSALALLPVAYRAWFGRRNA
jgi:uncharacterized membrane protein YdjX (TVP38/TMEM64 family)